MPCPDCDGKGWVWFNTGVTDPSGGAPEVVKEPCGCSGCTCDDPEDLRHPCPDCQRERTNEDGGRDR